MSVDQRMVVDAIGTDKVTGAIVLTVADQLDWSDVPAHLRTLQEKLNDYLNFLDAGEIWSAYPGSEGRGVRIDVVFRFAPRDAEVLEFLVRAGRALAEAGYSLSHRVYEGKG